MTYISWLNGLYPEDYFMYKAVTLAGGIREPLLTCSSLSIFLSFKAKFVSQFSPKLCKLESSNMVYICRMSDCIVGLRHRVMAFIFLFYPFFLLSLYYMLTLKLFKLEFYSGTFKARMLKISIHMDNELLYCWIENRTPCSYSSL